MNVSKLSRGYFFSNLVRVDVQVCFSLLNVTPRSVAAAAVKNDHSLVRRELPAVPSSPYSVDVFSEMSQSAGYDRSEKMAESTAVQSSPAEAQTHKTVGNLLPII